MTTSLKILIVDDEPELRQELQEFLTWHDITSLVADSAAQAAEILSDTPEITVVLTDIRMAGEDGLSFAERILASRSEADAIEAVVMTGHGDMELATRAVRAGVFDFLRKPMVPVDVADVVRRAHAKASARRADCIAREAELANLRADYAALQKRLENSGSQSWRSEETPPELAQILYHELRTPLVPLMALPDILSEQHSIPPEQFQQYLRSVKDAGKRLKIISDDLIAFLAPPDLGALSWQDTPLDRIIATVQILHAPAARTLGVALVSQPGTAGVVRTDLQTMVRALGRLVANAIAASPPGQSIVLAATADADDQVAFSVRDEGPGMTADEIRIAQLPFRQLDMSLSRKGAGMGLGLALASDEAVRLGGRLDIVSAPGKGTTASIIVPRLRAEERSI